MKRDRASGFFFATVLFLTSQSIVFAGVPYLPYSTPTMIDQSSAIVVASITDYAPDATPATVPTTILNAYDAALANAFHRAGTYKFRVDRTLKGQCDQNIEMKMPFLCTNCYGGAKFELPKGADVLLLLRRNDRKQWVPVDFHRPLIPLSNNSKLNAPSADTLKEADWIDVVLASLNDPILRRTLVSVLRNVKDDRVNGAVKLFADGKDLYLCADALYCMAVNQDISAIPKMADLANSHGPVRLEALQFYTTVSAVKLLNPLVLAGPEYLRLNAMMALRPLADDSSIPFLMYALEHDDRQQTVSYGAYAALHRLVPSLGPSGPVAYFEDNRDAEIAIVMQWWESEQSKAKKTQSATSVPSR